MAHTSPNIVLIMCDQMRWDAAGFAGSSIVQTPHLDQLAEGEAFALKTPIVLRQYAHRPEPVG